MEAPNEAPSLPGAGTCIFKGGRRRVLSRCTSGVIDILSLSRKWYDLYLRQISHPRSFVSNTAGVVRYTVRRPVICKVLKIIIFGVPPACLGSR